MLAAIWPADQIEELAIERVELAIWVERGNKDAHRLLLPLAGNRHQSCPCRRPVPASVRNAGNCSRRFSTVTPRVGFQHLPNRPGRGLFASQIDRGSCRGMAWHPRPFAPPGPGRSDFLVEQVGQRAGHVLLAVQTALDGGKNILPRNGAGQLRRPVGSGQPSCLSPITRTVSSITTHNMPAICAVGSVQGAIGEGVVGFLGIAAALQDEHQRFVP